MKEYKDRPEVKLTLGKIIRDHVEKQIEKHFMEEHRNKPKEEIMKLKPCPFCGEQPKEYNTEYSVACSNDKCALINGFTKEEWNTRFVSPEKVCLGSDCKHWIDYGAVEDCGLDKCVMDVVSPEKENTSHKQEFPLTREGLKALIAERIAYMSKNFPYEWAEKAEDILDRFFDPHVTYKTQKPKFRPYTEEEILVFVKQGRVCKDKFHPEVKQHISIQLSVDDFTICKEYPEEFLDNYIWDDGSPCGMEVEE